MAALADIAAALRDADAADKAEVYRQFGLRLTYQPINKRCALKWISARTVGLWAYPSGDGGVVSMVVISDELVLTSQRRRTR